MILSEKEFLRLPPHLQRLFIKLPNHGSEEVLAAFPEINSHPPGNKEKCHTNNIYGEYKERPLDGFTDSGSAARFFFQAKADANDSAKGRWDGSEEVLAEFPDVTVGAAGVKRSSGADHNGNLGSIYGAESRLAGTPTPGYDDSGSAARFFYSAKADAHDRAGSRHPTCKPLSLMQWLVRLVTPPGGTVLDPFAGTGTTAEACFREGMRCILIEREAESIADIERRMKLCLAGPDERARESIKARGLVADAGPLFELIKE